MGAWSGEYHIAVWLEPGQVWAGRKYMDNRPEKENDYHLIRDYGMIEHMPEGETRYKECKADAILLAVEIAEKSKLEIKFDWS